MVFDEARAHIPRAALRIPIIKTRPHVKKLTHEERSKQARINAGKSTGPKSEAGKANSRKNALKHGLTAKILAMPNEDPAKIAAREDHWNDYYNPQSPGAQQLVNLCVASTIMTDRVTCAYDAEIASQVRNADESWLNDKSELLEDGKTLLLDNPAMGYRMLRREATGCEYLVARWRFLGKILRERGFLSREECDEAIRLIGVAPTASGVKANADAFKIYYYNNLIPCEDRVTLATELLTDENRPHELWKSLTVATIPDVQWCQKWIMLFINDRLEELSQRGKMLSETIDAPDRAGAKDRALMLKDEKDARLFLRYSSEARNGFHRAFRDLTKALESDREMAENAEEIEETESSRNEAEFERNWNPDDRFDPLLSVLKEACGAALDPEMETSRNEADRDEAEDAETELSDLDRQIAEAKTDGEKRFMQLHRDVMASTYERSSRQRLVD